MSVLAAPVFCPFFFLIKFPSASCGRVSCCFFEVAVASRFLQNLQKNQKRSSGTPFFLCCCRMWRKYVSCCRKSWPHTLQTNGRSFVLQVTTWFVYRRSWPNGWPHLGHFCSERSGILCLLNLWRCTAHSSSEPCLQLLTLQ